MTNDECRMPNAGKRRRQPKVEDAVVVCVFVIVVPAVWLLCSLVVAIYEAWRRGMGA